MIEVRLKEAYACKMPTQSKGALSELYFPVEFLETSRRLVFTFCHTLLYSTDAPERMEALLCEIKTPRKQKKHKYSIVDG